MLQKPYLVELPCPRHDGIATATGTKVFAPDGTALPFVLGIRIELEPTGLPVAYLKVPVRVRESGG